jgi:hypothetical protein
MMKKLLVPVFTLLVAILGCSDDGGPKPEQPKPSPYSGYYYMFSRIVASDCAIQPSLAPTGQITIAGDEIEFFGYAGAWVDASKHGYGTSGQNTVIINPTTGCIGYYILSFDITFASLDSFSGTIGIDFTYSPQCSASACHADLAVSGKKQ